MTDVSCGKWPLLAAVVLLALLNFVDRAFLSSVLPQIQAYFGVRDGQVALVSSIFTVGYVLSTPLWATLGQCRHLSSASLLFVGALVWGAANLGSSFVPARWFGVFLTARALMGIGASTVTTLGPVLINAVFSRTPYRNAAFNAFYLMVPVGTGLSYVAGGGFSFLLGSWRTALWVTPGAVGLLGAAVLLLSFYERTPRRPPSPLTPTRMQIAARVLRNGVFVRFTLATAAAHFAMSQMAVWTPTLLQRMDRCGTLSPTLSSLIFGADTCAAGVLSIGVGVLSMKWLSPRARHPERILCGACAWWGAVWMSLFLSLGAQHLAVAYATLAMAQLALYVIWPLSARVMLDISTERTASLVLSLNVCLSYLLGSATGPFVAGAVSDALLASETLGVDRRHSLTYALLLMPAALLVAGALMMFTAVCGGDGERRRPPEGEDAPRPLSDDDGGDGDEEAAAKMTRRGGVATEEACAADAVSIISGYFTLSEMTFPSFAVANVDPLSLRVFADSMEERPPAVSRKKEEEEEGASTTSVDAVLAALPPVQPPLDLRAMARELAEDMVEIPLDSDDSDDDSDVDYDDDDAERRSAPT